LATEGIVPYELLADVLKKLGKEKELIERLETLHAADSANIPLGYFLAGEYDKAGRTDKAEPLYLSLLKKAPATTGYRSLIEAYRKGNRADKLVKVLGSLVDDTGMLESVATEAQAVVSDAELLRRVVETARQKAKAKDGPREFPYAERMAVALLAMEAKQYDTAAEFFELALAVDGKRANEVLLTWGVGLLLDERAGDAVKVFQRGVDLAAKEKRSLTSQLLSHLPGGRADKGSVSSAAMFQFYLAGALALADRTDEALAAARKAAELNKDSSRFASRTPWILYHAKRYDKAIAAYQELIAKFDGDHRSVDNRETLREARLSLSNLCVLTKRLPEAEECLEQVLDEFPDDVGASNDLGYLWADEGKHLQRSLAMIQRAVAAEPDNMAYRDSLGWIYYRLGRFPDAVTELEKALALGKQPGKPEKPAEKPVEKPVEKPSGKPEKRSAREPQEPDGTIFDHLGDAYLKAGRPEQAKDAWRRAIDRFRNGKEKDEEKAREVEKKLGKG
jgi:tetratricopeptide (TPR) repeat protein